MGAYIDGHLVAYLWAYIIDDTAYIYSQMSLLGPMPERCFSLYS